MTFARTKIQPPRPRSAYVERGRVQSRLAEALASRRVALICAPAGYGKTSLLAHEVARLPSDHAVAWISADPGDDLQRLLECLFAALEPFDPPWRTAPEALLHRAGGGTEDLREVASELINTLEACEVAHGVIVFDDLHRVDDPAFFRFLDPVIERLGPRWTVALASRTEPPIALARLRAADELAEFTQLQMQFGRDEARRLAALSGVDEALADRVFDRTQGWPAGMRIALGAAEGTQRADRMLRSGERPIFDFLVTEVIDQLRPELATFLLEVSVLPELEASRCAAVSGNPRAGALLDEIERLGLFVDVLEAPVPTLRLHDLFREALQLRLGRSDSARLSELRRRAAETEPDSIRRISLFLEAGEPQGAARLVFDHVPPMLATVGPAGVLHLISLFPAEFRERSPELTFVRGISEWVHWDFPSMLAHLERAEAMFEQAGDSANALHTRAYRGITLIANGRIDDARVVLESMRDAPLRDDSRAMMLNALEWLAIDTGRPGDVARTHAQLVDLVRKLDRPHLWYQTSPPMRLPGLPGITPILQRHAELLLRACGEEPTPNRPIALLCLGWCAAWRGDFPKANELVEQAKTDADWAGETGAVRNHLLSLTAFMHAIAGERGRAVEIALGRMQASRATIPWTRYLIHTFVARIAAICNDDATLREMLSGMEALAPLLDPAHAPAIRKSELALKAQLDWLEGREDDAIEGWNQALADEAALDYYGQGSEIRVRLARALAARGAIREAAAILGPAFERARTEGAPGGALLATEALNDLTHVPWKGALAPADVGELRRWCRLLGCPVAPVPADAPLSTRELEVLQRIAAGESNKVIARALDLSLHTVKRHVANILAKLGVETRGQAAAKWQKMGSG